MLDPATGPFLFDTSAERWFTKQDTFEARRWFLSYVAQHAIHVSSITVFERARGYALLWQQADGKRRGEIERARLAYVNDPGQVWPVDKLVANVGAEICAMIPQPPTAPKRTHRAVESRQDRLARWRSDILIASTALAADMLLIHNNAADFEAIRSAIEREPQRFPELGPLRLMRCASVV